MYYRSWTVAHTTNHFNDITRARRASWQPVTYAAASGRRTSWPPSRKYDVIWEIRLRQIHRKNNPANFHPVPIWNDGALSMQFESIVPTSDDSLTEQFSATSSPTCAEHRLWKHWHSVDKPQHAVCRNSRSIYIVQWGYTDDCSSLFTIANYSLQVRTKTMLSAWQRSSYK